MTVVFPWIYFITLLDSPTKLVNIPIMTFWYLINPKIFSQKKSTDGRNLPNNDSYF